MARYVSLVIVFLFTSFGAASEDSDAWRAFALDYYVDKDNGNGGRCPQPENGGWQLRSKPRAPTSLVETTSAPIVDETASAVRAAFSHLDIPPGFVLPPARATIWRARGGGALLVFGASAPSERKEQAQVWNEDLGRLVEQPAFAHQLSTALWIADGRATLIDHQVQADADLETYAWSLEPVDIVDIDGDGELDVVLRLHGYEFEELRIFTLKGTKAVSRLHLQGCFL